MLVGRIPVHLLAVKRDCDGYYRRVSIEEHRCSVSEAWLHSAGSRLADHMSLTDSAPDFLRQDI